MTTLATGVGAAIGAKAPTSSNHLLYASFYGSYSSIDLNAYSVPSQLGAGFSNPEDVALDAVTGQVFLTERAGTLLRLDSTTPDRAHATVLAQGMLAPQQIALSSDGRTAYVVEYGAGAHRLLSFDLAANPSAPPMSVIRSDLDQAVGVLLDEPGHAVYISEQAGTGTLTRIDLSAPGHPRTTVAQNLPGPFFLTWADAGRNAILVPLRDPTNRIVRVDLPPSPGGSANVSTVLDGVPFRPSSVTVLPDTRLVVCSDKQITAYELSAGPTVGSSHGPGGGGSFFCASINASDRTDMLMGTDESGVYRTTNSGASWVLQDTRLVQTSLSLQFCGAYNPADPTDLVGWHPISGLMRGRSTPSSVSWSQFTPPLTGTVPEGAAFAFDGQNIVVASTNGLHQCTLAGGTWRVAASAATPGGPAVAIGDLVGVAFVPSPVTWCFAADRDRVYWSTDSGVTWTVAFTAGRGNRQATEPGPINSLAVGTGSAAAPSSGRVIVYIALNTDSAGGGDFGVWRAAIPTTSTPSSQPTFSNISAGVGTDALLTSSGTNGFSTWPQYQSITTPAQDPDTVYVACVTSADIDHDNCWTVYRGRFDAAAGSVRWHGAYDGFTPHGTHNVQPGWIDIGESSSTATQVNVLGFGFGGPPHTLVCDAIDGNVVVQGNEAFVNVASSGAPQSPNAWAQRYTQQAQSTQGTTWRTTGLDDTNVWRYYIHPTNQALHFLANTDIGLSRSDDSGDTWKALVMQRPAAPGIPFASWKNVYELAFEPTGTKMWAAVSSQHDIPYSQQLDAPPGPGTVLESSTTPGQPTNQGVTWSDIGAGLPTGPAVSLAYDAASSTLYAAIWRKGVFRRDPTQGTWTEVGPTGPLTGTRVRRLEYRNGHLHCLVSGVTSTADDSAGLYRWNGTTWIDVTTSLKSSKYPLPTRGFYPFDFAIDPVVADTYWLCTSSVRGGPDGAVYLLPATGAAQTVLDLATVGTAHQDFLHTVDVEFDPTDTTGQTLYVTTETHGLWHSVDRGQHWSEHKSIPFTRPQRVTFDQRYPGVVFVATNGASAWTAPSAAVGAALQQAIRRKAYRIYQQRGNGAGHAETDWFQAQSQILGPAIQRRAYQLYQQRGAAPNHALDDWVRAESEARQAIGL